MAALVAALLSLPVSAAAEKPLVTVGWMTDTHVGETRRSCALVEKAYRLFKAHDVDVIINNGDIADHYYPKGYRHLRRIFHSIYPEGERKPLELSVFAWHDCYEWNGPRVRESTPEQRTACYAAVKKALEIPHERLSKHVVNGVVFLTVDQWHEGGDLERLMTEAEAEAKGLPVFVIDHVPPQATTHNSITWGSAGNRSLYERHPKCINLSGHTHGSCRDETQIYQGAFTSVNAGCLQTWGGDLVGIGGGSKREYGVMVFEVYPNRVVFHRFDVRDGLEYRPEEPWCVPWPFDPATAPYARERRAAASVAPQFAAGAKPRLEMKSPFEGFRLMIPPVESGSACRCRVSVSRKEAGEWRFFRTFEVYTQFYRRPQDVVGDGGCELALGAGFFDAGDTYRFEVEPVGFFGAAGRGISAEATVPADAPRPRLLWRAADPMALGCYRSDLGGPGADKPVKREGDWFVTEGYARLELPEEIWKSEPEDAKYRLTVEMRMLQNDDPEKRTFNTTVGRFKPVLSIAQGRVKTPHGDSGVQRYVAEFTNPKRYPYSFIVREGAPAKVQFRSVKLEVL